MANRNLLHMKQLEKFREWLIEEGWQICDLSNNPYEVLRARKEGRKKPLIVYRKISAREHLSLTDQDASVVRAFLSHEKNRKKADCSTRSKNQGSFHDFIKKQENSSTEKEGKNEF